MHVCTYMHVIVNVYVYMYTQLTMDYLVTAVSEKGGTGVKVHTLDRYGKPIPL